MSVCAATRQISQLYAADLVGGALACIGIVPVLNYVGWPEYGSVRRDRDGGGALLWAAAMEQDWIAGAAVLCCSAADRGELSRQTDRHRLRERHAARPALGGVREVERHLARGSR